MWTKFAKYLKNRYNFTNQAKVQYWQWLKAELANPKVIDSNPYQERTEKIHTDGRT